MPYNTPISAETDKQTYNERVHSKYGMINETYIENGGFCVLCSKRKFMMTNEL